MAGNMNQLVSSLPLARFDRGVKRRHRRRRHGINGMRVRRSPCLEGANELITELLGTSPSARQL